MEYLLGVDAGSSKISLSSYALDGSLLMTRKCQGASFSADPQAAIKLVLDAVDDFTVSSQGHCSFVAVGCSGIRASGKAEELSRLLSLPNKVVDDGVFALYSAFGHDDGILLISGTGSVCYGKRGGRTHSVGGWGHLVDDRGSGTWIALAAIKALFSRADHDLPLGMLDKDILSYFRCDVLSLPYKINQASKRELAALAPVVEDAAKAGDGGALAILQDAGHELAGMVLTMTGVLGMEEATLCLSGSIVEKCQATREALLSSLPGFEVIEAGRPERAVMPLYEEYLHD